MNKFSNKKFILGALVIILSSPPLFSNTMGDNKGALIGMGLSGALIGSSAAQLAADIPHCAMVPPGPRCAWVPLDIAEIVGGLASLLNNMKTEKDTLDKAPLPTDRMPTAGGPEAGGSPMGQIPSIKGLCQTTPSLCKTDGKGNPQLVLPNKKEISDGIAKAFTGATSLPTGLTLEQALKNLDDNYDNATQVAAMLNEASSSGLASGELGVLPNVGTAQHNDTLNLNSADSTAPITTADAIANALPDFSMPDLSLEDLMKQAKSERGERPLIRSMGLNAESERSGKLLTVFERVTRAIRGRHNRDIVMAKTEWTRKKALESLNKEPRPSPMTINAQASVKTAQEKL